LPDEASLAKTRAHSRALRVRDALQGVGMRRNCEERSSIELKKAMRAQGGAHEIEMKNK